MNPVEIDLSGLKAQFGLAEAEIDSLTSTAINAVTASIFANWKSVAKQELNSTLPEYLQNIIKVDKGRFEKQIMLTGVLPNMIEQGASPFDIKEGFKRSKKVKYSLPVYNSKGNMISSGGDWYLTIPFRVGVPGTLGQAGFSNQMPSEVYNIMRKRSSNKGLASSEVPSPHNVPQSRDAIMNEKGSLLYNSYQHKNSIYDGMTKRTAQYAKKSQNTYGTFRRAGANSDPLSWIHKGMKPKNLAERAVRETDVETIVENETLNYLETVL